MKAVTPLARRKLECVSDLTIDRWLLGETPGSDEARRLEEHMKGCTGCASRIGALRGLYSTQAMPASQQPPVRLAQPPAETPGQHGAVQFLILRDGLLVGSEFFTPGTYVIGSDPRADLQLDGVSPLHARLYFRDGKVAVKAESGTVLVSGFKIDSCEVRSIDEVVVGPYVLRARVIRERWSDVHGAVTELTVVDQPAVTRNERALDVGSEERTDVGLPSPQPSPPRGEGAVRLRLIAELWWGDTRQAASSFENVVTARDFPLWGFDVSPDFVIASPSPAGGFVVNLPHTVTLSLGETHSLDAGAMRLTFRVDEALPMLPRAKLEGWPVVMLSAAMLTALFVGTWLAPEPEEVPFTPRTLHAFVKLMPPPKKEKPPEVVKTASTRTDDPKPTEHPHPPARTNTPPRSTTPPDPFASLKRLIGDRSFKAVLDGTKSAKAGKSGPRTLFAGLALPGVGKAGGFDLGTAGSPLGIGARGLKNTGLTNTNGYGLGRVGGQVVERPTGERMGLLRGNPSSIDKDALAKAINDHLGEVSACYEKALIRNGGAGGKLALEWTVTTSGSVASAKVKNSTLKDGSIASCVLSALKGWRFPPARGGPVVVSYPFIFHSSAF